MTRSLILLPLLVACGEPARLQYDWSRAYTEAMTRQTDLSRQSAADAAYPLEGAEGLEIRVRVLEVSTDAEEDLTVTLTE